MIIRVREVGGYVPLRYLQKMALLAIKTAKIQLTLNMVILRLSLFNITPSLYMPISRFLTALD